jgi:predicted glutamine amidotransferase
MLGIVARGPIPYELFEEFADLADGGKTRDGPPDERGHKDGWGVIGFRGDEVVEYGRGGGSAHGDPHYAKIAWDLIKESTELGDEEALVVQCHIRRASDGATRGQAEYAHPFLREQEAVPWAFQHNGGIEGASFERIKTVDSVLYFETILPALGAATDADVESAFQAAKGSLVNRFDGYSSLTALLGSGTGLHAYREAATAEGYFTLQYEAWDEMAFLCSEPILGMKGRALDQKEFLHVPSRGAWPD